MYSTGKLCSWPREKCQALAQTKTACAEQGGWRWTEVSQSPEPVGSCCLESGCCWLWVGFWVLEEGGGQWEVIKFVLLADPTLCPGCWQFLHCVHLPAGFLHCSVGFKVSMGIWERLVCNPTVKGRDQKDTPVITKAGEAFIAWVPKWGFQDLPLAVFWCWPNHIFVLTSGLRFLTSQIRTKYSSALPYLTVQLEENLVGTGLVLVLQLPVLYGFNSNSAQKKKSTYRKA